MKKAVEHGLADLSANTDLSKLADISALSERTLARRFRDELDMTWTEFRHRARMIKAMELLALADRQVTQTSLDVGFESTSAFIRAFRQFSGMTPHAFQKSLDHTVTALPSSEGDLS